MEAHTVGDQSDADHQQESEREHTGGRMPIDKSGNRSRSEIHDHYGDHDGNDHHTDMLGHADRRDDRINLKYQIDCRDLRDNQAFVPALWFAGKDGIYVVDDDGGA